MYVIDETGMKRGGFNGGGSVVNNVSNNVSGKSVSSNTLSGTAQSLLDIARETNAMNLASARETNEFNSREAEKQRDWEKMMSDTAHQREVEDLIKAGLNPILSINSGASTPSGATASGTKANFESGIGAIASIISASINASTSLKIAELNAKTNLEMNAQNNSAKYDTSFYGNIHNLMNGLGLKFDDIFSAKNYKGKSSGKYNTFDDFSWSRSYFGDLQKQFSK